MNEFQRLAESMRNFNKRADEIGLDPAARFPQEEIDRCEAKGQPPAPQSRLRRVWDALTK